MSEAYAEEFSPVESLPESQIPQMKLVEATGSLTLYAAAADEAEPARQWGRTREIEGKDSVALYLEEIARTPLLTAADEVELSKRIEAGVYAQHLLETTEKSDQEKEELEWLAQDGFEAKQHFVAANLRLVVSIAKKQYLSSMPLLDRIQEGNNGLMHAVEMFDFTKGYKFSTYGSWWIRQSMTRGIAQQERIVRLPVHVLEDLNRMQKVARTMEHDLGREVSPKEIAEELGVDTSRVLNLMTWGKEHLSFDMPLGDEGDTTLGEIFVDEAASVNFTSHVEDKDQMERLDQIMQSVLSKRDYDIVRLRFGLVDGCEWIQKDIGKKYDLTPEGIRQIVRRSIEKVAAEAFKVSKTATDF